MILQKEEEYDLVVGEGLDIAEGGYDVPGTPVTRCSSRDLYSITCISISFAKLCQEEDPNISSVLHTHTMNHTTLQHIYHI